MTWLKLLHANAFTGSRNWLNSSYPFVPVNRFGCLHHLPAFVLMKLLMHLLNISSKFLLIFGWRWKWIAWVSVSMCVCVCGMCLRLLLLSSDCMAVHSYHVTVEQMLIYIFRNMYDVSLSAWKTGTVMLRRSCCFNYYIWKSWLWKSAHPVWARVSIGFSMMAYPCVLMMGRCGW